MSPFNTIPEVARTRAKAAERGEVTADPQPTEEGTCQMLEGQETYDGWCRAVVHDSGIHEAAVAYISSTAGYYPDPDGIGDEGK